MLRCLRSRRHRALRVPGAVRQRLLSTGVHLLQRAVRLAQLLERGLRRLRRGLPRRQFLQRRDMRLRQAVRGRMLHLRPAVLRRRLLLRCERDVLRGWLLSRPGRHLLRGRLLPGRHPLLPRLLLRDRVGPVSQYVNRVGNPARSLAGRRRDHAASPVDLARKDQVMMTPSRPARALVAAQLLCPFATGHLAAAPNRPGGNEPPADHDPCENAGKYVNADYDRDGPSGWHLQALSKWTTAVSID